MEAEEFIELFEYFENRQNKKLIEEISKLKMEILELKIEISGERICTESMMDEDTVRF